MKNTAMAPALPDRGVYALVICAVAVFWFTPASAGRMVEVFEIHYGSARDVAGSVRILLGPGGKLSVDESANYIIVSDEKKNVEEIRALIGRLDKPPKTIMAEVEFAQESAVKPFAVDIRWKVAGTGWMIGSFPGQGSGFPVSARAGMPGAMALKKQFLRLLENRPGKIFVGESVPSVEYFIRYGRGHGYITGSAVFKNAGTSFNVTAKTAPGNKIMVSLEPEVSSYEQGINIFQIKNAAVSAVVDDPGTLVIGGNEGEEESFGGAFLSGLDGREEKSRFLMILTVKSEK